MHFNRLLLIFLALVSLFLILRAFFLPVALNDDSLITLCYAKNIALGNGFVFNHPPAVLGTTTPLFTVLMVLLAWLIPSVSLPSLAFIFTVVTWLLLPWLFYFFRREWRLQQVEFLMISAIVWTTPWVNFFGMEAYFFAFLLVLAFSIFLRKQYFGSGILAGLLFLTRGEGALVALLMGLVLSVPLFRDGRFRIISSYRAPALLSLGFLLIFIPWVVYAEITFGAIFPNTLAAKLAQGKLSYSANFWEGLVKIYLPLKTRGLNLAWFNFAWPLVLLGLFRVGKKNTPWLLFVGWITLYVGAYTLMAVPSYPWYYLPVVIVLNLLLAHGLVQCLYWLMKLPIAKAPRLGLSALLVTTTLGLYVAPYLKRAITYQGDNRKHDYIEIANWFNENTEPSDQLAFVEIGYLGFYTQNRIIDLAGLVLPKVTDAVVKGGYTWAFWHYRPDYYLYRPAFDPLLGKIYHDPRFLEEYEAVAEFPDLELDHYTIYKRKD